MPTRLAFDRPLRLLGVLMLLAAAGVTACQSPQPPASTQLIPVAPDILSPRGAVPWPIVFAWKPVPGGDWVYRVTVSDQAERVLYEQDTRGRSTVGAPAGMRSLLSDDASFVWYVAIIGPDGTELARSATVPFSLK
jgi:hypothetical protein